MAAKFGTAEWASALVAEINGSSEYRNAAKNWGDGFNGNMIFVFEADDQLSSPLHLFIELAKGSCAGAGFIESDSHENAGFVLRAPFTLWREILERKTMAATAILTGKMKVDGGKMTLLKHTAANRALIHCTASVETEF
ncbi:MAG: SCP2 sterol-binding domain-containing protein [Candidatus Eisenbacteria bacterium]|uniref:SCP2 sterol-binding domain-containing protein n=1 Tax=Eiseniibacteriota bacterium TaxID=2212470 RepID=A0A956SCY9_UNCEI|nr:SCP2 sterol-binding domain-containing protein [Candidatus Eisenbacteria bacterium]